MEKDFYTVKEFAVAYGCSPDRVYEWLRIGKIKHYERPTPHAIYRIPKTELARLKGDEGTQERTPTEQASKAQLHDEKIFEKSDSIINERGLLSFLERLEFHQTYLNSTLTKVKEFRDLFRPETNKYVDGELTSLCDELVNALTKLIRFLSTFFKDTEDIRTANSHGDTIFKFTPQNRYFREYEEYLEELLKLVNTAREAYSSYRAAIRRILFV
jgi:hypothetical protein